MRFSDYLYRLLHAKCEQEAQTRAATSYVQGFFDCVAARAMREKREPRDMSVFEREMAR